MLDFTFLRFINIGESIFLYIQTLKTPLDWRGSTSRHNTRGECGCRADLGDERQRHSDVDALPVWGSRLCWSRWRLLARTRWTGTSTVDADPATEQVVLGPRERQEILRRGATTDSAATAPAMLAIDAAVNSWQKDAHAGTLKPRWTSTPTPPPQRHRRRHTNDAVEAASHHHAEDENESPLLRRPRRPPLQRSRRPRTRPPHTTLNSSSATPSSVVDGRRGAPRVRALRRVLRGLGRRPPRRSEASTVAAPRVRRLRRAPGSNQRHVHDEKIGRPTSQARHGGVLRDGASRGDGGRVPGALREIRVHPRFSATQHPLRSRATVAPGGKTRDEHAVVAAPVRFLRTESVSTRSWVARAKGVAPAGLPAGSVE